MFKTKPICHIDPLDFGYTALYNDNGNLAYTVNKYSLPDENLEGALCQLIITFEDEHKKSLSGRALKKYKGPFYQGCGHTHETCPNHVLCDADGNPYVCVNMSPTSKVLFIYKHTFKVIAYPNVRPPLKKTSPPEIKHIIGITRDDDGNPSISEYDQVEGDTANEVSYDTCSHTSLPLPPPPPQPVKVISPKAESSDIPWSNSEVSKEKASSPPKPKRKHRTKKSKAPTQTINQSEFPVLSPPPQVQQTPPPLYVPPPGFGPSYTKAPKPSIESFPGAHKEVVECTTKEVLMNIGLMECLFARKHTMEGTQNLYAMQIQQLQRQIQELEFHMKHNRAYIMDTDQQINDLRDQMIRKSTKGLSKKINKPPNEQDSKYIEYVVNKCI